MVGMRTIATAPYAGVQGALAGALDLAPSAIRIAHDAMDQKVTVSAIYDGRMFRSRVRATDLDWPRRALDDLLEQMTAPEVAG